MVLRIQTGDISTFAGMRYDKSNNTEIDEYIKAFLSNNFHSFQIEDDGQMNFDLVCYLNNQLKSCKMFTKVDYDDDGTPLRYWLCFTKL